MILAPLSPPARGGVRPFDCAQDKLRREGVGVKPNDSIHTPLTLPSPARGEGKDKNTDRDYRQPISGAIMKYLIRMAGL
jgi:hypothetical protein